MAKITTVIDIGSNSVRMAIFEKSSRFGFHLLYEIKSRVRISEGSYEFGGILQEIPMQRALNALSEFKKISDKFHSRKLLCVATSAIRDAPNAKEFVNKVKRSCKIAIKIIDGQKEAFYGGVACANLLHKKNGITIDIGGGSTECALIKEGRVESLVSLNIGTIRLKELFFDKKRDLKKTKEFIQKEFEKIPKNYRHSDIFGVGGTIRAISKMIMKNSGYPIDTLHGYEIDVKKYSNFIEKIYTASEDKLILLGVSEDRRDNISSGALILFELIKLFNAQIIITSSVGVREGVFLSDLLRNNSQIFPPNLNPSLISLKDRFLSMEARKHAKNAKSESLRIFEVLKPLHKISDEFKFHLEIAAELASLGRGLCFYDSHKHSAYFLLHALEYGFSHKDKAIICLLVEFSSRKIPKDNSIAHIDEIMPPILTLQWLSFVLGITEAVCVSDFFEDIEYCYKNYSLELKSKSKFYLARESIMRLSKPMEFDIKINGINCAKGCF